jgi:hypothetical protein
LKISEVGKKIFGYRFPQKKVMYVLALTKIVVATFWATFSFSHLVTLLSSLFQQGTIGL